MTPAEKRQLLEKLLAERLMDDERALLDSEDAASQICFLVRLPATIEVDCVRRRMEHARRRHAALRQVFPRDGERRKAVVTELPLDMAEWPGDLRLEVERPFRPETEPPLRVRYQRDEEGRLLVLFVVHHVLLDHVSAGVLLDEMTAPQAPVGPVAQLAEFRVWHDQVVHGAAGRAAREHWRQALREPYDRPFERTPREGPGPTHRFLVPDELDLERVARERGVTLSSLFLAAYQVLLARWSGRSRFMLTTPVSVRTRAQWRSLVGYLVRLLPVRSDVAPQATLGDLAGQVQARMESDLEHVDFPFALIRQDYRSRHGKCDWLQAQFSWLREDANPDRRGRANLEWGQLEVRPTPLGFPLEVLLSGHRLGFHPLELLAAPVAGGVEVTLAARDFDLLSLQAMAAEYLSILEAPDGPALPTAAPRAARETLHGRFEEQARRSPEALAVGTWTYDRLRRQANGWGHELIRRGLRPGEPVRVELPYEYRSPSPGGSMRGVFPPLPRGPEATAALLGVLQAGGLYAPEEEKALALQGSVDPAEDPVVVAAPEAAFVVDNVVGTHAGLLNRIESLEPWRPGDVSCPHSDDLGELLGPLLGGARVCPLPEQEELVPFLQREGVTRLALSPSHLQRLLHAYPDLPERLPALRCWFLSGEPLPISLARPLLRAGSRVWSLYGCAETSGAVCAGLVTEEGTWAPVGKPIGGHAIHLEEDGTIRISGPGLAAGYWSDPLATRERFLGGQFRTGDRGRWRPDGQLEIVRRQATIRGETVDLDALEAAMRAQPGVRGAAVTCQEGRLLAYYEGQLDLRILPAGTVAERLEEMPRDRAALGRVNPRLAALWADALGRSVDPDARFFDCGGDSLMAARLAARIEAELGVRLPLSSFLTAPTLRQQSRLFICRQPGALVPLRLGGDGPPLLLVHPAGGTVLIYRALAARLRPGYPIYGLEALDGLDDVETLAERYLREVRAVLPDGPYRFGGLSLGGMVAFEMARRHGDERCPVLMIDAYSPTMRWNPRPARWKVWLFRLQRLALHLRHLLRPDGRRYLESLLRRPVSLRTPEGSETNPPTSGMTAAEVWKRYRPQPWAGAVTLLRAYPSPELESPANGWGPLCGSLAVRSIPGLHGTMLLEAPVCLDAVVAELDRLLS